MIEEIKERLKNRTPGKWEWVKWEGDFWYLTNDPNSSYLDATILDDGSANGEYPQLIDPKSSDAVFIAHAPTDIEYLLKEVERLRGLLVEIGEHVDKTLAKYSEEAQNE